MPEPEVQPPPPSFYLTAAQRRPARRGATQPDGLRRRRRPLAALSPRRAMPSESRSHESCDGAARYLRDSVTLITKISAVAY
jgi:hypothetical protein